MKKGFVVVLLLLLCKITYAQQVLSLDSCRAKAMANNKSLLMAKEKVNAATYKKKAAATNYFPSIQAMGGYMLNSKSISILSDNQIAAIQNLGPGLGATMQQLGQALPALAPSIAGELGSVMNVAGQKLVGTMNELSQSVVDAFDTDTRNMFAGAISLTQPLYMGGKIRAYNKISKYAEALAEQQHNTALQEVILTTDQVYWQVVSLANKKKLAEGYVKLLAKLDYNVQQLIEEGVATQADGLSVRVKLNEAEMTLTKVEDGLNLSRMLLCQLCGMDLTTDVVLADEDIESIAVQENGMQAWNLEQAFANRPELRSLELASMMYKQKVNVVRAGHLPSLALMGNYMFSTPAVFNGFENKLRGMWNVGVMVKIPICHWGEGIYKVKAAKSEARIAQYQWQDVKEKVELQVNQAAFKVNEAAKKLVMAEKNREKAEENLRYATLGFEEGVIATSNVLEAQTAWLAAQSERIDAQIDVKLTEVYLKKSLGILK